MNIQTERLENHTARLTVEVEAAQLEKAKQDAARKIARQVNIPGFRKGKAPYRVLVNYLGEGAILEEAVETLSNQVYKNVLDEAEVEPYGPGSLEDFSIEPQPTFKFVVPLQPTVDLGNYRDIRLEYEAPVIEDKAVDDQLKAFLEREALIEESSKPVAAGNRVTLSMKAEYLDVEDTEDEAADSAEEAEAHDHDHEHDHDHDHDHDEKDRVFIDNDNMVFRLTEEREPAPGFTEALIGATAGERRDFEITYPDDTEEYEHLAGRHVKFDVTIQKIETVTLPELNDEFAARVSPPKEEGEEPPTLLQLRMNIREELQNEANEAADSAYAQQVLDKIIEQAAFAYPEMLVTDEIEHLLRHLDSDLRRSGLTLDDYMKVANKSREDLRDDYRDNAVASIKRSLAVRELIRAEQLTISDEQVSSEIDKIAAQFGEQAAAFRSIYEGGTMRDNLRNDLLYRQVMERIASIGKGEAPELVAESPESGEEDSEEQGESA